jgi:hypothetical protein
MKKVWIWKEILKKLKDHGRCNSNESPILLTQLNVNVRSRVPKFLNPPPKLSSSSPLSSSSSSWSVAEDNNGKIEKTTLE